MLELQARGGYGYTPVVLDPIDIFDLGCLHYCSRYVPIGYNQDFDYLSIIIWKRVSCLKIHFRMS